MFDRLICEDTIRLGPTVMVASMLVGHWVRVIGNPIFAAYMILLWGIAWFLMPRPATVAALFFGAFVIGAYVGRL